MEEQKKRGVTVTAAKPHISLSSTLTRDGRFETVIWEGKQAWWIKGRPRPDDLEFLGKPQENGAAESVEGASAAPPVNH